LFSGVFVGEIFLLKPVLAVFLSSSMKLSFFFGDTILMSNVFFSSLCLFGDIEGLFIFCGDNTVCTVLAGDVKEIYLTGEDLGVLNPSLLLGDSLGVILVSINSFSILSNSPHSKSISCSIGSILIIKTKTRIYIRY